MARPKTRRFWRIARSVFRWCRIWLWLIILVLVGIAVYFNTIGLPDFLKKPLLSNLRERGWEVQFSNMRWHWYRGILIDNARFTPTEDATNKLGGVQFSATEADLNLNFTHWRKSQMGLDGFIIRSGQLILPAEKNRPELVLTNIHTNIRLLSGDRVLIQPLEASFRGARIKIFASVTNVSALRDLDLFRSRDQTNETARAKSQRFWELFEQCTFSDTPELEITFRGDGADLDSSRADVRLISAGAETPWGKLKSITLDAELNDDGMREPHATARIRAADAETDLFRGQNIQIVARLSSVATNLADIGVDLEFTGSGLEFDDRTSIKVQSRKLQGTARATLDKTKVMTATGRARVGTGRIHYGNGTTNAIDAAIQQGELNFAYDRSRTNDYPELASTAFDKLRPFTVGFNGELRAIETRDLAVDKLKCAVEWKNAGLDVEWLDLDLYGGRAELSGSVNAVTRKVAMRAASDFDVQRLMPLLPKVGQRFVSKYTWQKPPHLTATLTANLPPWTNREPDWAATVLPTLTIDGHVAVGSATYRKIEASSAAATFHFSNYVWRLPEIHVVRPEGNLRLELLSDNRTGAFCWRVDSQISPGAIRHLLDEEQQRGLDKLTFSTPPAVKGEICGLWNDEESIEFRGDVAVTNFSFRDLDLDRFTSSVEFTNKFLRCTDLHIERSGRRIDSPRIEIAFATNRVFFTDVESTIDPHRVVRVIGRDAVEAIAPYHFAEPPHVLLNGGLTIGEIDDADLHFVVAGENFSWEWFRADKAAGDVIWKGRNLLVTNALASAYGGGDITGWCYFNFAPRGKADYHFNMRFADVDVQAFVKSLGKSNSIEGSLKGDLRIHQADTSGLETWQGQGRLELHDGLIWEIPIFGIFTPVLNAVVPGMGKSRAREATGNFVITNGVAFSDDFEIRASAFRMQYRGFIDSQQRVDARVMAEIFRDAWGVGRVVSWALMPLSKLFEYRVGGTVENPETEPVYIPKFLLKTFRPFHTIKEVLSDKPEDSPPPAP